MGKTGIDSYSLHPLHLKPHEVLQWAQNNGADGVHFSSLPTGQQSVFTQSYLHDLGQMARELGLYIEWGGGRHIPFNVSDWSHADLLQDNLKAAGEAVAIGTRIIRSGSGGMVHANHANPSTANLIKATVSELRRMIPMLRDKGVVLAIETNFEFTTFELLKIFEMCEVSPDDCLGICLDTMNLLTMLENPVQATERALPWVVCTHIKDGGLVFSRQGLTAFPSKIGSGIIDVEAIMALVKKEPREINFSLRSEGGSYLLPVHEPWYIDQFPDLTISEYNNLMLLENHSESLITRGQLSITTMEEWGKKCEEHTKEDLKKLKQIHQHLH